MLISLFSELPHANNLQSTLIRLDDGTILEIENSNVPIFSQSAENIIASDNNISTATSLDEIREDGSGYYNKNKTSKKRLQYFIFSNDNIFGFLIESVINIQQQSSSQTLQTNQNKNSCSYPPITLDALYQRQISFEQTVLTAISGIKVNIDLLISKSGSTSSGESIDVGVDLPIQNNVDLSILESWVLVNDNKKKLVCNYNFFMTCTGSLVLINSIIEINGTITVVCSKFKKLEEVKYYPLSSSQLGIFKSCLRFCEPETVKLTDLIHKYIVLPVNCNNSKTVYCIPML